MSATYTTRTFVVACTDCGGPRLVEGRVEFGICDTCDGTGLVRKADGRTGA